MSLRDSTNCVPAPRVPGCRRPLAAFLGAVLASTALAQAPAAAIAPDATILFELLGSANAIGIDLPEEVREVLVFGQYRGEVHVSVETAIDANDGPRRLEIVAGGVTAVGRCAATAFARLEGIDEDGTVRRATLSARCFGEEDHFRFAKLHPGIPLFFSGRQHELPLDTWIAFEAMRVGNLPVEVPADAFVFYVYLDTSGVPGAAGTPDYDTWEAAARAFD